MVQIDYLLESSFKEILDKVSKSLNIFQKEYFKDMTEDEFNDLLELVHIWYYGTHNASKRIKPLLKKSFMRKLKVSNPPKTLYRGLAFKTIKSRDEALKKIKKEGLSGLFNKSFTSWSSDKRAVKAFLPGGYYYPDETSGILLEIKGKDFKDLIVFSLSHYIKTEKERRKFLQLVAKIHIKNLDHMLTTVSPKKLPDKNIFAKMQGSVFAVAEDEYVLNTIKPNRIKDVNITMLDK